jgi:heat shock protein HtpX
LVVRIIQFAVSRERGYLADASAVQLTRYPEGLINALEKIKLHNEGKLKVSEAVSHLFFTDPKMSFFDNIFSTHPPIEARIERLRSMY